MPDEVKDDFGSFEQAADAMMRWLTEFFRITVVDQNRGNPRRTAGIDVAPAVADHEAAREIDAQFALGAEQHAGLRLATVAFRRAFAGVITDFHAIDGERPPHVVVNRLDGFLLGRAAANVRLVGGDDEEEASPLQLPARLGDAGKNLKLSEARRRVGFSIAGQGAVDNAVAIEENGALSL